MRYWWHRLRRHRVTRMDQVNLYDGELRHLSKTMDRIEGLPRSAREFVVVQGLSQGDPLGHCPSCGVSNGSTARVDASVDLDRRNFPMTRTLERTLFLFSVMFFSPRIAPNTGNAIRMVAAHGLRTASGRAARIRPVRTQAAPGRPGLPRPGVGDRAPESGRRLGRPRAGPGVRVHRARDDVVRRRRLPAGRRADVRPGADRPGRRHAGRPAHHRRGCASRCWRAGDR